MSEHDNAQTDFDLSRPTGQLVMELENARYLLERRPPFVDLEAVETAVAAYRVEIRRRAEVTFHGDDGL